MPYQNSERPTSGLSFAIGAIVGGAIGYFLATDEGRKFRHSTAKKVGDMANQAQEQLQAVDVKGKVEQGKSYVSEVGTTMKGQFDQVASSAKANAKATAGRVENGFQRGMQLAKDKIQRRKAEVNGVPASDEAIDLG